MAEKGGNAVASRVEADGALVRSNLPGYGWDDGTKMDQVPFLFDSGTMAWATATAGDLNNGEQVAPCDLEIMGAVIHIATGVTGTNCQLDIGDSGDQDKFLDGYILATDATSPVVLSATEFASTSISQGDLIGFSLPQATATTGEINVVLIAAPR